MLEQMFSNKFWFNNITSQEAENLRKQLAHEKQTITIFIDNWAVGNINIGVTN